MQKRPGPARHDAALEADRRPSASDCRCLCGSLVARLVPEGVELRCRRCKRTLVLPFAADEPGLREVAS